jgi:Flp pilus assembly protein TadG
MMRALSLLSRIRRNQDGATLIEFTFVAPIFVMLLLGGLDIGYSIYLRTVGSGTLEATARTASLQGASQATMEADIRAAMNKLLPQSERANPAAITITQKSYTDYSRVDQPELLVIDTDSDGLLDIGDCWADEDEDGQFGVNQGRTGLGGSDDAVYYTVTMAIPRLFPMHTVLGWDATQSVTVKTVIINQPYGSQPVPPTECRET